MGGVLCLHITRGTFMRPKHPGILIELPTADIVRDYEAGMSFVALGAKYGVSRITIARRVHGAGVKVRHQGPIPKGERHRYARFVQDVRQHILQLEEAVADKQVEVGKREAELKQAQAETPKEANAVVAKLKKADVELRDFESKLATLRGVGAR